MGERTIVTRADVIVPRPPNFLRMALSMGETNTLPLSALSDESLREIGAAWTEALIERAAEQRQEPESNAKD